MYALHGHSSLEPPPNWCNLLTSRAPQAQAVQTSLMNLFREWQQLWNTSACVGRVTCPERHVSSLNKCNPTHYMRNAKWKNRGNITNDILFIPSWCIITPPIVPRMAPVYMGLAYINTVCRWTLSADDLLLSGTGSSVDTIVAPLVIEFKLYVSGWFLFWKTCRIL